MSTWANGSLLFIVNLENQRSYSGVLSLLLLILMRLGHTWCLSCRVAILFRQRITTTVLYLGTSRTLLSTLLVDGFMRHQFILVPPVLL